MDGRARQVQPALVAVRQILHVDMDAFYAAVEQRDDPSLRGRPVLVGGRSPRSVVSTASYEARPSGARSAMPMGEALRRCPDAVVVPPRMSHYADVSRHVMGILRRFSPLVEPLSLDEAFVDVTASRELFGDGTRIAETIREAIRTELSLTASAGVATTKFVAKVASDLKKPDGLTVVPPGGEASFLAPLPVGRMWGVGPKAAQKLAQVGVRTIGDLARSSPERLSRVVGTEWGAAIHELAQGIDPRPVVPEREAVSMGAEETFDEDLVDRPSIERELLLQSERVAQRLAANGLVAQVVTVKVKYHDFTLVTRRATLPEPVFDTTTIHKTACALLDRVDLEGKRVRLTGVSVSSIVESESAPRTLFPDETLARRGALEKVALLAAERFGKAALVHAETLGARTRRR
jgi:DNA polymerase-4